MIKNDDLFLFQFQPIFFPFFRCWNAIHQPFWCGSIQQIIVEKLAHSDTQINAVGIFHHYSLFKKDDLYNLDYDFKFFVNLDNDSVPEIIRASGYSDGINYYITKQNLETPNESILFYFNPIIKRIENNKFTYYWGYAWTLNSILLSINGETKILCSLNHTIKNEGEIYHPENQIQFPAIIFSGEPKSSYEYPEKISQTEWLTIDEIINRIRK